MALSNLFIPNDYEIYVNDINDTTNRVSNLWVDNINGNPYPPGGGAVPSLVRNKFLRTTDTVTPSMFWGDVDTSSITHGTARQVLHTNSAGTAVEWTTNLSVPGTLATDSSLTVDGSSDLKDNVHCEQDLGVDGDFSVTGLTSLAITDVNDTLDVKGNMEFNGVAGAANYILQKTSTTTQAWTLQPQVRYIRYSHYLQAQDLNSAAGPLPVQFYVFSPITDLANATYGSVTAITQPSSTQFTIGTAGTYDITINGYCDPASTGPVGSMATLSIEVDTVELAETCIVVNTFSFTGTFTVAVAAGKNIRILTRRVGAGTGNFTTFASGLAVPSFASTITLSLVNTVV